MSEETVKEGRPGDTVQLKDQEAGFTDPETGFDISRDQKAKLGDTVGERTQQAILSGGLLIVSGSRQLGAGASKDAETAEDGKKKK